MNGRAMDFEARTVGWEKPDPSKHVKLEHVVEEDVTYADLTLDTFGVMGSRFTGCVFRNIRAQNVSLGAGMDQSVYVDCTFDRLKTPYMAGGRTRFERCIFTAVDIRDWRCFTVEMVDCTFSGRLRGGFFNGTVPVEDRQRLGRERNEFHGNDFSQALFGDVDFRTGIDLTRQRLPEKGAYLFLPDAPAAIAAARASIAQWEDEGQKDDAEFFLAQRDDDARAGQHQLFIPESVLRVASNPGQERVIELLRQIVS